MSDFRDAQFETALARRDQLPLVTKIALDGALVKIVLALNGKAFDHRQEIDRWMFDVVLTAFKAAELPTVLPTFRGVDDAALERALTQGIDVVPSDSHWYGAELEKALEYGGDYPSVLMIDSSYIQRPWRVVPSDAPQEKHSAARGWAPLQPLVASDGSHTFYSRLPLSDRSRGSDYEKAYAWYIPGDARDALVGYIQCVPT